MGRRVRAASPIGLIASGPVRWFNEKVLGIDRGAGLPRGRSETFASKLVAVARKPGAQRVTLFNDTFTNHYDPEDRHRGSGGSGARRMRGGRGPPGCCGRPLISQGLLAEARKRAGQMVDALYPDRRTRREDSVLRAELSLGGQGRRAVAAARRAASGRRARRRRSLPAVRRIRRDARSAAAPRSGNEFCCTATVIRNRWACWLRRCPLLSRIPSATVVDLDAGCCGMAGSFGYHALRCFRRDRQPQAAAGGEGHETG